MKIWTMIALLLAGCGAEPDPAQQKLQAAAGCDAAVRECQAQGPGGLLSFSLAQPRTMQPTAVRARWQGGPAESVLVNFGMVDMDMGDNRYRLLPDDQGGWRATAVLPLCMQGRSDWFADLKVREQGGAVHEARFFFTVAH